MSRFLTVALLLVACFLAPRSLQSQLPDTDVRLHVGAGIGGQVGAAIESISLDGKGLSSVFVGGGNTTARTFGGEASQAIFTAGLRWFGESRKSYTQLAWNYIGVYDPVSEPPRILSGPQLLVGYRFGETVATPLGLRAAVGYGCGVGERAKGAPGGGCIFSGELSASLRMP